MCCELIASSFAPQRASRKPRRRFQRSGNALPRVLVQEGHPREVAPRQAVEVAEVLHRSSPRLAALPRPLQAHLAGTAAPAAPSRVQIKNTIEMRRKSETRIWQRF